MTRADYQATAELPLGELVDRLAAAGAPITRAPELEPWGLREMWLADPDGVRIVLVEIPADHPLRHDTRSSRPR